VRETQRICNDGIMWLVLAGNLDQGMGPDGTQTVSGCHTS